MIGGQPHTKWLPNAIARDLQGYIMTGRDLPQPGLGRDPLMLETSMPGVFAAGDVRHGSIKRVASAVGDGATVVRMIHEHLRETAGDRRWSVQAPDPEPPSALGFALQNTG